MDITRWSMPKSDWLCSLQPKIEILYTVSKRKMWSWLWLISSAPYYLWNYSNTIISHFFLICNTVGKVLGIRRQVSGIENWEWRMENVGADIIRPWGNHIRTCPHRVNVQFFEHNFVWGQGENPQECCRISRIFNVVIGKICRKDAHESLCGQVLILGATAKYTGNAP